MCRHEDGFGVCAQGPVLSCQCKFWRCGLCSQDVPGQPRFPQAQSVPTEMTPELVALAVNFRHGSCDPGSKGPYLFPSKRQDLHLPFIVDENSSRLLHKSLLKIWSLFVFVFLQKSSLTWSIWEWVGERQITSQPCCRFPACCFIGKPQPNGSPTWAAAGGDRSHYSALIGSLSSCSGI